MSHEEMVILQEIGSLGREARRLKVAMVAAAAHGNTTVDHLARLEELRQRRRELEPLREAAWRRKMISLGHLPDENTAEAAS